MKRAAQLLACPMLFGLMVACTETGTSAPLFFTGACDASAAVALNRDLFVVANDEDNILRVYSRARPGPPVAQFDLTAFLRPQKRMDESDLEGAARIGDRIYWISSHGRNAKGKERETRHRFFATTATVSDGVAQLRPTGSFYSALLDDMLGDARLHQFNLRQAAELAPKTPGALNIEGLTSTREGHLLIGFRNPVPQGKALVLPLLNPADLIAGKRAQFGEAMTLDLGGYGIRSLASLRDRYFIIAGAAGAGGESRLYEWLPGQTPKRVPAPEIQGLNPEAVSFYGPGESESELLVVSDDGTTRVANQECKKVKNPNLRKFRAVYLFQ